MSAPSKSTTAATVVATTAAPVAPAPTPASATTNLVPAPSTTAVALTAEQTELIARVACYERLQIETEKQIGVLRGKLLGFEEELFKQLCPQTDLGVNGRLAQRLRTFETSATPVSAELALLERFAALLKRRLDEFLAGRCDVMLIAYGRRLEELAAKHVKEQAEADAVKVEIRRLEERVAECQKHLRTQKQAVAKA